MTRAHRARITAVVVVVAGAVAGCSGPAAEEVTSDSVVSVRAAVAVVGAIRGVVHATGVVTPSPGAELIVVAPEGARIMAIAHAAGDRVHRGEVLVHFEVPALSSDLQRQQAELTRAEAALRNATAAQTRASDLFDRGVAARREVEESERAVAEAEAALTETKAALGSAEALASRATVRADFDGVVARRFHNPGDVVAAADPILRVIDPRRLEVVAAAPLADVSRIAVGAAAHVSGGAVQAGGLGATVVAGPAAVEPGAATVPLRLALVGSPSIPVGAPVQVDIDAERHVEVILVPVVAIVREGEGTSVFVADGTRAQRRAVVVGLSDGVHTEIVSGIKAGERIIVEGQAGLPDGASIAVEGRLDGTSTAARPDRTAGDRAK
jgi:RND family efflux transporter MFP subunit